MEPSASDAVFVITIWLVFQLLLQQTPRIIGIEKDPNPLLKNGWDIYCPDSEDILASAYPIFILFFCAMIFPILRISPSHERSPAKSLHSLTMYADAFGVIQNPPPKENSPL